jgi:hypothetical protein
LALLVFGCCVALAAWPPASRLLCSGAGGHVAVRFDRTRLVAEAGEGKPGTFSPAFGATRHLPTGVVVERATGHAQRFRVTVPMAVNVAAAGLLWLAVVISGARARLASKVTGGGAVHRPTLWLWRLRYAAGTVLLCGAFYSVYSMPRSFDGGIFTDVQALHVCAASFSIYVATMLITFD